ncbi:hypothetical protein HanIR_Chr16g0800361 [Helianthus annuus]|nr:hypothetical protein HanIR_Chr16g0800361 [Helianthus annuus]
MAYLKWLVARPLLSTLQMQRDSTCLLNRDQHCRLLVHTITHLNQKDLPMSHSLSYSLNQQKWNAIGE